MAYAKVDAFADAVREFEAAYALVPKPVFLFNIGLAFEKMGRNDKALEAYRRYLTLEPDGDRSAEARARVVAIERGLPEPSTTAGDGETQPSSTEGTQDQEPVDSPPATTEAPTPSEPSQANDLPADIQRSDGGASPGRTSPGRTKKITGLAVGGVGLLSIGLGIKFAVDVSDKQEQLDALEPPAQWDQSAYDDRDSAKRLSIITLSVGAALVIGGGVLYYLGHKDSKRGGRKLVISPAVGDSFAGFALAGRF